MQQLHSVRYEAPIWDAPAWLFEANNTEQSCD
ncbi:hypothetical protein ACVWXM_009520 [Bradyrhizobium sp. GM7.3]